MYFDSKFYTVGFMKPRIAEEIEAEPMLFGADWKFAAENGGPITRDFLEQLHRAAGFGVMNRGIIIDSRVHMLQEGYYPCIPGWHTDDAPRNFKTNQPDIFSPKVVQHALAVVDTDTGSTTEFITGRLRIDEENIKAQRAWMVDGKVKTVYEAASDIIDAALSDPPQAWSVNAVPNNAVCLFNSRDWHRGVPAKRAGWRFFIRASHSSDRKIENKIRKQVQVYLPRLNIGW